MDPRPIEYQRAPMPLITLRTLDTEWIESLSPPDGRGLFRNETYDCETSVWIFSRRTFMGPTATDRSSKRERR